jgi:hypothetical protein
MCVCDKTDSDVVQTCGCDFYAMISTLWRLHLAARNKQMQQCSLSSRAHISSNSYGRLYQSFRNSLGSCASRLFSLRWGGFCSQSVEIGGITCCSRGRNQLLLPPSFKQGFIHYLYDNPCFALRECLSLLAQAPFPKVVCSARLFFL